MPKHPILAPLTGILAGIGATPSIAQSLLERVPVKEHFAPIHASAYAIADVDLDGHPDVIADDRLYLGDGRGGYQDVSATHMPPSRGGTRQVLAVDVDADGDPDLLLGQGTNASGFSAAAPRLLINDGTGRFTDRTATSLPASNGANGFFAVGDVDGDGDPDLALGSEFTGAGVGRMPAQNQLFLNDGAGNFFDRTATHLPAVQDNTITVVLLDVEGDGDLDLAVGNVWGLPFWGTERSRIYLNDSTGRFTLASTARLPAGDELPFLAIDLDRDGDMDLLSDRTGALRNDGSGSFTVVSGLPVSSYGQVAVTDVEGDGDEDLVYGHRIFISDGAGAFTEAATNPGLLRARGAVVAFDGDGDGDDDLLFGGGQRYLNDGSGHYIATHASWCGPPIGIAGTGIASADFDGDGETDLLAGGTIYLQHRGLLEPSTDLPLNSSAITSDLDGDGDQDIVTTSLFMGTELFWNDGLGGFTRAATNPFPAQNIWVTDVVAFDVEGDGDPDLVFAVDGQDRLYLNDGLGGFTDATARALPASTVPSSAVAAADIDGDGDLDLVFATGHFWYAHGYQNRVLLNVGSSGAVAFIDATASHLPVSSTASFAVASADLDGDGDLDLVFGNQGQDSLLLNDGTGRFQDASTTNLPQWPSGATRAITAGDLDEDGDVDLVFGRTRSTSDSGQFALLNDGRGAFSLAGGGILVSSGAETAGVALMDLDRDGDLDLTVLESSLWPSQGGPAGHTPPILRDLYVVTNLTRQLVAPRVPVLGQEAVLRFYARGPSSSLVDVALPFLATGTARTPIPDLGILGLDPNSMAPLLALVIPQPAGVVSIPIPVPADPSLAGIDVHAQALTLRWPGSAKLTNVTHDVIFR